MKINLFPKPNKRKKRQAGTLKFENLESRRLLTVNGAGVSDSALFDTVINLSDPSIELIDVGGIEGETVQVNVAEGGGLGEFLGGTFSNISFQGGSAGFGSEVNLNGGEIGISSSAFAGSEININSGSVGPNFNAFEGSVVNINGGFVGIGFEAFPGSEINLNGGDLSLAFVFPDSVFTVNGGEVSLQLFAQEGSVIDIKDGDVFSVVPADGIILNISGGNIGNFASTSSSVFNISGGNVPGISASGSEINISGGVVEGRIFGDNEINISGGVVEEIFSQTGAVINLSGGTFGPSNFVGSEVNISDGTFVEGVVATFSETTVDISGGTFNDNFLTTGGVETNITGGTFDSFSSVSDGTTTISGGTFGELRLTGTGTTNLIGSNFQIDGEPIPSLVLNEAVDISEPQTGPRVITLSGEFADGSPFSFDFGNSLSFLNSFHTLTLTLIEPETPVDPIVVGTDGDDILEGSDGDDNLVGGAGSDTLIGSAGNDVFTTDAINGDNLGDDQDVIQLGNVDGNDTGNDVVTDFDINNLNGGEGNFDTIEFTFDDTDFSLATGQDILDFVDFIESDGDQSTDAILDGSDLILVFGRDAENSDVITSSLRLEDVLGDDGLTFRRLRSNSVDILGSSELDIFASNGAVNIGDASDDTLTAGDEGDVVVGGRGSDTLIGGTGNDVLTGDQSDGDNDRNDQDLFVLGDVSSLSIGNDVITDFDTDNFNGGESNFDTLSLSLGGQDFLLSTGNDIVDFASLIENDGNSQTGTLIDGDDIVFVFGRNADGLITDSIRLEDVIGDDGLTNNILAAFDEIGESDGIDIFV